MIRDTPDVGMTKVTLVSLPEGWSKRSEVRWTMKRNPETRDMVWVNEKGDVRFKTPEVDEIMTFEERKFHPEMDKRSRKSRCSDSTKELMKET